jgi:hypothetical protein
MEHFLSFNLCTLLGNNTHTIENSIDLGNETLLTITCIKDIEDTYTHIQLEKISLFFKELLDNNTISCFSKTESTQLIMFQIMINNKK